MSRMDLVMFITGALATARLTRLVTTDRILLTPRAWAISRLDPQSLAAYLVVCDWCVSVYAGAAVAGALWAWPGPSLWVCAALSFSYVSGLLARGEET